MSFTFGEKRRSKNSVIHKPEFILTKLKRFQPPPKSSSVPILQQNMICVCDGGCSNCYSLLSNSSPNSSMLFQQLVGYPIMGHREGKPLPTPLRSFFESRFGYSFNQVRIHTDREAAKSSQSLNAQAYTLGNNIVFNHGYYAPHTNKGKLLLAHELTHVIQQKQVDSQLSMFKCRDDQHEEIASRTARNVMDTTNSMQVSRHELIPDNKPVSMIQCQKEVAVNTRADDPGFLLCLALCELGIPPGVWRKVVGLLLQAVWEEYRMQYGEARARVEFQRFRTAFYTYSPFRVLKMLLTFVVQGKIGLIPVRSAAARALQVKIERFLLIRGATTASIIAAEQILRKVVFVVEAAIAAGCSIYCGSLALSRAIISLTEGVAEALVTTMDILGKIGTGVEAIGKGVLKELFLRPVLYARAVMDPSNWDLSSLPINTRMDLTVLGLYLRAKLQPDDLDHFFKNIQKPLRDYQIPKELIETMAASFQNIIQTQTGFNIIITPDILLAMTPLTFVNFLVGWRLLNYIRDPDEIADSQLASESVLETENF